MLAAKVNTELNYFDNQIYQLSLDIRRVGNILVFSFWFFLILILSILALSLIPMDSFISESFAPCLALSKSLTRMTKSELIDAMHKKGVKIEETKAKTPVAIHKDKKNKTTTTLYRSGALPMIPMWAISTILTYAHKIPGLSKIIGTLAKWYGRTTIWKLLVSLRKLFIIFNAILGVLAVFTITGFSTDNIIGGFYGVGVYYFEMLGSFIKRLFTWFFDFFDYRIVPNVPDNPPSGSSFTPWSNPRPNASDFPSNIPPKAPSPFDLDKQSLRSLYTDSMNINTPSGGTNSWSFTTWLWYIGVGAAALGAVYIGAKIIIDPTIVSSWLPFNGTGAPQGGAGQGPAPNPDGGESIARTVAAGIVGVYKGAMSINQTVWSYMNPSNYFGSRGNASGFTSDEFIEKQLIANAEHRNNTLYPFTPNNPYDNWFTSARKHLFGEYSFETQERRNLLSHLNEGTNRMVIKNNRFVFVPELEKTGINVSLPHSPIPGTPIPGTPAINLGIAPGFEADNTAMANVFSANLAHKLSTVPAVPSAPPVVLEGTSEQWSIPGPSQPLAPIEVASRVASPTGSIDVSHRLCNDYLALFLYL